MEMKLPRSNPSRGHAFTILEVIIACAIFFIAGFAILELVTTSVASARKLQQREPDAGMVAAVLSLTNKLFEGTESGDFADISGNVYKDYSWTREVYEVGSNGYFQVDFYVFNDRRRGAEPTRMSARFYRPESPPGSATQPR
jgi:Tfp pilus assembly protein PilV